MSHSSLPAGTKAAIRVNLELELTNRKDKLVAMCEAQIASLRSRLERRVNRIPSSKRNLKLVDLLDDSISAPTKPARVTKPAPTKKAVAPAPAPAEAPPLPSVALAPARKTRAAPTKTAAKSAPKTNSTTSSTTTRGKKRPSDDGDKENELSVPKKRTKTTAPVAAPTRSTTATATRSTRAASRKVAPQAPQVLSPKPNNSRSAPRTRRQR